MPGTLFHKAKNLLNGMALGAVLAAGFSFPAFAACSNPTGAAGAMGYFSAENIYKYCDDTNWIAVGSKAGDVTSGLVAHWKFDETSGTTSTDIIGGVTATLSNGAQFAAGKYNNAAQSTDAVNDYVSTGNINLSGTSAVTIAFWTNRTWNSAGGKTLFEFSDNFNSYTDGFGFFPDDSTCSGIYMGVRGDVGFNTRCYTQPSSGVWHHIAAVFDKSQAAGGEVNLYINGVLRTANSSPSNSNNGNATTFGNRAFYMFSRGGTLEFNPGYIDDFRVYNRALSAVEIAKLAENNDSTGLVMHWKLNENTGTSAGDSSAAGNSGTLRGGASWTANGYTGSGVTFDGIDGCIDEGAVNLSGTDDITVSAWYKRNWGAGGGGYETLYEGTSNFNGSTTGYAIFPTGSGPGTCPNYKLEVYLRGNSGHNGKCYDPPGDSNWHMLTAVYDKSQAAANEVAFYIDGVLQTATSQPHNSNNTNNFGNDEFNFFTRNCNSTNAAESVEGTGDDVRIYNRALSAGEIAALIDCSNPAGRKGMINYNTTTHRYEYCNGTSWLQMDTQCTNNDGGAGCAGGIAGTMRYNATPNTYEYCEGDAWICSGEKCYQNQINGVTFDGTNDYLTRGGDLTGSADSKMFTASFWFRRNGGNGTDRAIIRNGPPAAGLQVSLNASNRLYVWASGSVIELNGSTVITDSNWHHVMMSFDMSNPARRHIYLDGVAETLTVTTYNDAAIDFTQTNHAIGAGSTGGGKFDGDLADMWQDIGTYMDLSLASNRARFYNGGEPVNLGCDGSYPTGSAPEIFLSGATANWATNKGTGGGFTENGALTDAATDP